MQPPDAPKPRYSIILPARNEESRIGRTLQQYQEYLDSHCVHPYEILVVANACTDRTVEVVSGIAESSPALRLIDLQEPGKGRAILEGFRQAKGEVCLFCDSDGSTDSADILELLQRVAEGECDCAIGSRWLPQSRVPIQQPFRRRLASRVFNLAVRLVFGFPYKDTQCGAKAFNRKALEIILTRVNTTGYHFDCEVLWRLKQSELRVLEMPVTWRDCGGSSIRLGRDGLKMFAGLLKIRFDSSSQGRVQS